MQSSAEDRQGYLPLSSKIDADLICTDFHTYCHSGSVSEPEKHSLRCKLAVQNLNSLFKDLAVEYAIPKSSTDVAQRIAKKKETIINY